MSKFLPLLRVRRTITTMFRIDDSISGPPYRQVKESLIALIATGEIAEGDKLPAIRPAAQEFGMAAGTVARAYRELEEEGVVVTRRGAGTRVAMGASRLVALPVMSSTGELAQRALAFVTAARESGFAPEEILAAIQAAL